MRAWSRRRAGWPRGRARPRAGRAGRSGGRATVAARASSTNTNQMRAAAISRSSCGCSVPRAEAPSARARSAGQSSSPIHPIARASAVEAACSQAGAEPAGHPSGVQYQAARWPRRSPNSRRSEATHRSAEPPQRCSAIAASVPSSGRTHVGSLHGTPSAVRSASADEARGESPRRRDPASVNAARAVRVIDAERVAAGPPPCPQPDTSRALLDRWIGGDDAGEFGVAPPEPRPRPCASGRRGASGRRSRDRRSVRPRRRARCDRPGMRPATVRSHEISPAASSTSGNSCAAATGSRHRTRSPPSMS